MTDREMLAKMARIIDSAEEAMRGHDEDLQMQAHAVLAEYQAHLAQPVEIDDAQKRDRWMRVALGKLAPAGTYPQDLFSRMWHAESEEAACNIAVNARDRFELLYGYWDNSALTAAMKAAL